MKSDSAVFYLARHAEGLPPLRRFVESYKKHPAGIEHQFVVIFKGFERVTDLDAARGEFAGLPHTEIRISDEHFDIGAYLYGAANIETDYVCFLNTHTQILASSWLSHLRSAMNDPSIGLAGAFASFESLFDSLAVTSKAVWLAGIECIPFDERLADCYRFILKMHAPKFLANEPPWRHLMRRSGLKWAWRRFVRRAGPKEIESRWQAYWATVYRPGGHYGFLERFPRFPNPHLRSNGFIIERDTLLRLFPEIQPTKHAAYAFESGDNSLSAQVIRTGKKLALVDRHGQVYGEATWSKSKTFRLGAQENLMFSDNQTRAFDNLSEDERNTHVMMSWGLRSCDRSRAYPLGFSF
jgi:hypothetical protein